MTRYKLWISLFLFLSLLFIAYYLSDKYAGSSSLPKVHRSFPISDTSKVDKIFIADQDSNTIMLEEKRKGWTVNDSFLAQKHKVDMLLETFHNMRSKGPVADSRRSTVIKNMSALNKTVEVYKDGSDEPFRTYYIGTGTPRQDGTYMLLETPDLGKAERPYIVHIPSRRGFLNPRFFTSFDKWRFTGVFNYELENIERVELENVRRPEHSFYMKNQSNGVALYRMSDGKRIHDFDSIRVNDYLLSFKKAHVETYQHGLTPRKKDSILSSGPVYRLRVIDAAGDTNELKAYLKPAPKDAEESSGRGYDVDRMYAMTDEGKFAMIQRYVFGRFFQPLSEFRKDYSGKQRGYRRMGPTPPDGYTPVPRNKGIKKKEKGRPN